MKLRLDLVLECKADSLRRLFAVIAMHASEISEIRLARTPGPSVSRMRLELEGVGNPRDLHDALLQEPSVRAAEVLRQDELQKGRVE